MKQIKQFSLKNGLTLLICLIQPVLLFSQNPYFINYSVKDGLPSSNIYCVQQDDEGYIWFGTDVGLVKYDGYSFTVFTKEAGLSDNEIFQIKKGNDGKLWFLTLNGIPSYYEKEAFHTVNLNSNQSFYLTELISGEGSEVFIGTSKGEVFQIKDGKEINYWQFDDAVLSLYKQEETMLCLTRKGVWKIDLLANKTKQLQQFKNRYYSIGLITDSLIIVAKRNEIFLVSDTSLTLLQQLPLKSDIIDVGFTAKKEFYIGTRNGIFIYDKNDLSKPINFMLQANSTSKLLLDSEDNLWVTTLNNGVYFSALPNSKLYNKESFDTEEEQITALAKDSENNLWIGSNNNTYYNLKTDTIIKYHFKGSHPDRIGKIRIYNDSVWIIGKASMMLHTKSQQQEFYYRGSDFFYFQNKYWLSGSQFHIYCLEKTQFYKSVDFNDQEKENYPKIFEQKEYLKHKIPRAKVFEKNNSGFWIGGLNGLYSYHQDKIKYYGGDNPLFKKSISDILYAEESKITYVATWNDGVYLIKNKKLLHHFTSNNSVLKSNIIRCLTQDNEENVWIGSSIGVFKIENNLTLLNQNAKLGIENIKVNDIEIIASILNLATDNGLLQIDMTKTIKEKSIPVFKIDSVLINGENKQRENKFDLKYNENNIVLHFTGLLYKNHSSLSYSYQLEGYNEKWFTQKTKKLKFVALPYGKYKLRIKAINQHVESELKIIEFSISPPFWKTWWFNLTIGLSFLLLVFFIWKKRESRLQFKFNLERQILNAKNEKIEVEKNIIEIEQKALRMQMNPHFIFNALNTIKGYYAENKTIEANDYIVQFSKLLRNILESSSKYITLNKEIEIISCYLDLAKIRHQNTFNYVINVDKDLVVNATLIPPMLIQPVVENAIIHGISSLNEGLITIDFVIKGGFLICKVKDNGIGRTAARLRGSSAHKSISIELTQERLNLINNAENNFTIKDLYEGEKPKGTLVQLIIPLEYA